MLALGLVLVSENLALLSSSLTLVQLLVIEFRAVVPKGTMSCRIQGRISTRPSVDPSPNRHFRLFYISAIDLYLTRPRLSLPDQPGLTRPGLSLPDQPSRTRLKLSLPDEPGHTRAYLTNVGMRLNQRRCGDGKLGHWSGPRTQYHGSREDDKNETKRNYIVCSNFISARANICL